MKHTRISNLLAGNRFFLDSIFPKCKNLYQTIGKESPIPEVLIISCCDARVSPEYIFNARPGKLFVLRNIGAFVPAYDSRKLHYSVAATLEYAINILNVSTIVTLTHSGCAGIAHGVKIASSNDIPTPLNVNPCLTDWLKQMDLPASGTSNEEIEKSASKKSLENIMSYPYVSKLISEGKLETSAMYFDIAKGSVQVVNN